MNWNCIKNISNMDEKKWLLQSRQYFFIEQPKFHFICDTFSYGLMPSKNLLCRLPYPFYYFKVVLQKKWKIPIPQNFYIFMDSFLNLNFSTCGHDYWSDLINFFIKWIAFLSYKRFPFHYGSFLSAESEN